MTISKTPEPPYYAVVFTNQRTAKDDAGYGEMAARMDELAARMPGYLGIESTRDEAGFAITVSYWDTEEAITNWKRNVDHLEAQSKGRSDWYKDYMVRVSKVERAYAMKK